MVNVSVGNVDVVFTLQLVMRYEWFSIGLAEAENEVNCERCLERKSGCTKHKLQNGIHQYYLLSLLEHMGNSYRCTRPNDVLIVFLFGQRRAMIMKIISMLLITAGMIHADISDRPITIRLPPQNRKPNFMKEVMPPRPIQSQSQQTSAASTNRSQKSRLGSHPSLTPTAQLPVIPPSPVTEQQFVPRLITTPPPPPPLNIPPDVQNQLIKFFGLDSFGIPGLTGNHPDGFAGAIQELRAAGIPVQGLPLEHISGSLSPSTSQNDVLSQANPAFGSQLNQLYNEATGPTHYRGMSNMPLPEATPGENGLIGLLSSSIRKLVQDTGVADALSQGIPSVLGTGGSDAAVAYSKDAETEAVAQTVSNSGIRRQQNVAQRVLSGVAAALGAGGGRGPAHAGLPRIPGFPLLPGGIPRNEQGQIDVVQLIGSITRRISNGTTLADVIPPEQLQTLADNVTDALLPPTPEDFDLHKFMGRWFEGINSPRATEQRCVVHHYGGLTKNDKTATFTALKIYREGSEFGPVRYSIGYAFRGGNKDAMLQLHSSETSDAQPFWIYKLGPEGTDPFGNPQYEWAVVSNWVKYPVTVLVRDPDKFKAKYEQEVLRWLEDQGFINGFIRAFNMLQPASYSSCQYADSTFEVFGPSKRLT
ncbi:LiPocalin-Related protein [Dirofilaria immitis]|nr:LiPocalin-Related protein [Dirofilaria immitis]